MRYIAERERRATPRGCLPTRARPALALSLPLSQELNAVLKLDSSEYYLAKYHRQLGTRAARVQAVSLRSSPDMPSPPPQPLRLGENASRARALRKIYMNQKTTHAPSRRAGYDEKIRDVIERGGEWRLSLARSRI